MDVRMKTIICDIDGTLLDYLHDKPSDERGEHVALPGAVEKMQQWEVMGCRIIIITGRRESERKRTVAELEKARIPYDVLLMGYADSGRVLINDVGKHGNCKAHAVSLPRDQGFKAVDWSEVGL
jgi:3-deoxy-D-manno-octulosonate 8-phosphate phosphatase KdsC-like HAD superfamily phosphatase|tara:strand:- start:104 stop:475 length:372 start_codon:yes stop_codon:yes gene_type:complete